MGSGNFVSDSLKGGEGLGFLLTAGTPSQAATLTESDRKKAEMIWGMLQTARKWKEECGLSGGVAQLRWDFWRGKQWQKRRPQNLSMCVINMTYEQVETFVGTIGEDLPESNVLARKPENKEAAEIATKIINWTHDLNDQSTDIELPVRSAVVTGSGFRRVDWDWSLDGKRGAPRLTFVDEAFIFVAPHTKKLQDASYLIEAKNVPLEEIRKRWPDRGVEVPGGVWDGSLTPVYGNSGALTSGGSGDVASFTIPDGTQTQQSKSVLKRKDKSLCTLIEAWIRQDDGTLRYVVCANGLILQDDLSPYEDDLYPYAAYNVIRNKDSVYGISLVELLESMQKEINEVHSYALDQQRYESDTPLVVSRDNMDEAKAFTNAAGSVYFDNSTTGQGYYLLNKPGANPKWFDMEDRLHSKARSISGGVDILHGERPAGVTTLGGMEIIKEQANVVVSKMTKHVFSAVRAEDRLILSRIKQFMKDERVVRVTGLGGEDEYVTINERTSLDMNGDWEKSNVIPEDFEADVDFSPTPPGGFQAKLERSMALLEAGVVDPQYVLEEIEEPVAKIQALQERMAEQQKAQMKAEQAAKGQLPPESEIPEDDPQALLQGAMNLLT